MGVSRYLIVLKLSGTEGHDTCVVGMAPGSVVADVESMFNVFPLIPLP